MYYIKIDLSTTLPYLVESFKGLIGKDSLTLEKRNKLINIISVALKYSSYIQIIGMEKPIYIEDIYQQLSLSCLIYSHWENKALIPEPIANTDILSLVKEHKSAVIKAGPGDGKTTLVSWLYIQLCKKRDIFPILIILRWTNSINDLMFIVDELKQANKIMNNTIVLIIDGYDELDIEDRKKVSKIILEYESLNVGVYYLTCRLHYDIYDLKVDHYHIKCFSSRDAKAYCNSFLNIYGSKTNANSVVEYLNGGFKNQLQCDRLISYHISRGFLQWRNGSAIII